MTADTPLLRARDVRKSFGSLEVLKGVDVDVRAGEVLAILGPSGSGKSTFLRCLNHIEGIDGGSVRVEGELLGYREDGRRVRRLRESEIARQRRRIGMVFQQFNLFPHMTVLQNVTDAPIGVNGEPRAEAERHGVELLERVGLADKVDAYPKSLSGGQQQRVAIARALAMRPKLMLFDEPTSALDPELIGEVLKVIADLAASGMTMVIVTHEMRFARQVADRAVFMDAGRIVEEGPAARVLDTPRHPRTRAFLSRMVSETTPEPTAGR
jgi:polar amino acid transport system ATP-binding protein